jgi:hypothetical protein
MTRQTKNRLRAFVLLVVFSLNTLAGFACSIGVDMGYNTKHHELSEASHNKDHKHAAAHKHSHVHKNVAVAKLKAPNDDCCTGQVNSFAQLDKSVAYNNLLLQPPVFLTATLTNFFNWDKEKPGLMVNSRFQFVRRSCSLYNTDIRIAIQSFQI